MAVFKCHIPHPNIWFFGWLCCILFWNCTPVSPIEKSETYRETCSSDASSCSDVPTRLCVPGTEQCRCTPTGACGRGMLCTQGRCSTCPVGTAGCACTDQATCENGLRCKQGKCQGCQGAAHCACYSNGRCNVGHRCVAHKHSGTFCQMCPRAQRQGCDCNSDTDCGKSLRCIHKRCTPPQLQLQLPMQLECYTPCQQSVQLQGGTRRICDPKTKLMKGCRSGQSCQKGSCVSLQHLAQPKLKDYPFCRTSSECPSWQTCIHGRCYSNCSKDSMCGQDSVCHRYICKKKCVPRAAECPSSHYCQQTDTTQSGICTPITFTPHTQRPNSQTQSFSIQSRFVELSPTHPSVEISIRNLSPYSIRLTLRKQKASTALSRFQMLTLSICSQHSPKQDRCIRYGTATSSFHPIQITLSSQKTTWIRLQQPRQMDSKENQDRGVLELFSATVHKSIHVRYRTSYSGRWKGTFFTFGHFKDKNIEHISKHITPRLNNAFLQHYMRFKTQRISFVEFQAILQSIQEETWKQKNVQRHCSRLFDPQKSEDIYCYPNASPKGYGILTPSNRELNLPTRVSAMPFSIAIQDDGNIWKGHILTSETLHYMGNPSIQFQLTQPRSNTHLRTIQSIRFKHIIGGRYSLSETRACAKTEHKRTYPWLRTGFKEQISTNTLFPKQSECRSTQYPLVASSGTADTQKRDALHNADLNQANPIPDGHAWIRTIELLDGWLYQDKLIFLLVREKMQHASYASGFLKRPIIRYGYIVLRHDPEGTQNGAKTSNSKASLGCKEDKECHASQRCIYGACQSKEAKSVSNQCDPKWLRKATGRPLSTLQELKRWTQMELARGLQSLLYGQSTRVRDDSRYHITRSARGYGYIHPQTQKQHFIHYFCEDTQQLDGGPSTQPNDCPVGSRVIYFDLPEIDDTQLRKEPCNTTQTCFKRLQQLKQLQHFRENVPYRCQHKNEVLCDTHRQDPRKGKIFFKPSHKNAYIAPFRSFQEELNEAFRYTLKFATRTGSTLGFTPEICPKNSGVSASNVYCYSPQQIVALQGRLQCIVHFFSNSTLYSTLQPELQRVLQIFLVQAFGYSTDLQTKATYLGFETLYAELNIMLGDEAYIRAVTSRYDASKSRQVAFDGTAFESNGVRLSGVLGFEMSQLYTAVQYYQSVTDRFFLQLSWMSTVFKDQSTVLTAQSLQSILQKVQVAILRKAKTWGQIAQHYHKINRADLARAVLERAYTQMYLENSVFTHRVQAVHHTLNHAEQTQAYATLQELHYTYKSTRLRMQDLYRKLSLSNNRFGLEPGYIPLPAIDRTALKHNNEDAFSSSLATVEHLLRRAKTKEQQALNEKRLFDVQKAQFQNALRELQMRYNEQLIQICGSFKWGERRLPATRLYTNEHPTLRLLPEPCGRIPGSALHQAYIRLESLTLDAMQLRHDWTALQSRIYLEKKRVETMCKQRFSLSDITWKSKQKTQNLQLYIRSEALIIKQTIQTMMELRELQKSYKCQVLFGMSTGGNCQGSGHSLLLGLSVIATKAHTQIQTRIQTREVQKEWHDLHSRKTRLKILLPCKVCAFKGSSSQCEGKTLDGVAKLNSMYAIRNQVLAAHILKLRALHTQYSIQLALSHIVGLEQKAKRLQQEYNASRALLLRKQSAQNDPTSRIVQNTRIIEAERSFEAAARELYALTRIYEYLTGQSYAYKGDLWHIRRAGTAQHSLEAYLEQLEQAYLQFKEKHGTSTSNVLILSVRDTVLNIPQTRADGTPHTLRSRIAALQDYLHDPKNRNEQGHIEFSFNLSLDAQSTQVSPLSALHTITYIQAELIGGEVGDALGTLYVRQSGTGILRMLDQSFKYLTLPPRTAVVHLFFNGHKELDSSIYKNMRLYNRPLGNTQWKMILNPATERANRDISLKSINDIRLYIHYRSISVQ